MGAGDGPGHLAWEFCAKDYLSVIKHGGSNANRWENHLYMEVFMGTSTLNWVFFLWENPQALGMSSGAMWGIPAYHIWHAILHFWWGWTIAKCVYWPASAIFFDVSEIMITVRLWIKIKYYPYKHGRCQRVERLLSHIIYIYIYVCRRSSKNQVFSDCWLCY